MFRSPLAILIFMKLVPTFLTETTDFNCGPNTVPVTSGCVDFCPPTCTEPSPQICPAICLLNGCNCEKGFIREEFKNSSCIPISECPNNKPCNTKPHSNECGPHEVLANCSNVCEPTCSNPNPISCPLKKCKTSECLCAKDYIRRDSQEKSPCILISQCPCTDCQ